MADFACSRSDLNEWIVHDDINMACYALAASRLVSLSHPLFCTAVQSAEAAHKKIS